MVSGQTIEAVGLELINTYGLFIARTIATAALCGSKRQFVERIAGWELLAAAQRASQAFGNVQIPTYLRAKYLFTTAPF